MYSHHTQKKANSQSADGIFPIYKCSGETLATLIKRFRDEQSFSPDVAITYAGRLDPMADGLVLLLVGEICKEKDKFLNFDKTYTFEILFGVATDTFDMLGLITETKDVEVTESGIQKAILEIKNKTIFPYPPFSSKPVDGQPLFMHAKAGTLPNEMPIIKGEIKDIGLKSLRSVSLEEIVKKSLEIIVNVEGDFRQEEIIESWKNFLEHSKNKNCFVATLEVTVSSGVYVRTLAVMIGEALGSPALAYSITRTKVGEYQL